jgi:hypothetical protein
MRIPVLLLCLVLAGCSTAKKDPKTGASPTAVKPPKTRDPIITPAYGINGKIALVNDKLRYVVLDFTLSRKPEPETRLNVYRNGQKVGEVKISNQAQESFIAADITAGDVKPGDEVREN